MGSRKITFFNFAFVYLRAVQRWLKNKNMQNHMSNLIPHISGNEVAK